jgi:hypothetical protein
MSSNSSLVVDHRIIDAFETFSKEKESAIGFGTLRLQELFVEGLKGNTRSETKESNLEPLESRNEKAYDFLDDALDTFNRILEKRIKVLTLSHQLPPFKGDRLIEMRLMGSCEINLWEGDESLAFGVEITISQTYDPKTVSYTYYEFNHVDWPL